MNHERRFGGYGKKHKNSLLGSERAYMGWRKFAHLEKCDSSAGTSDAEVLCWLTNLVV